MLSFSGKLTLAAFLMIICKYSNGETCLVFAVFLTFDVDGEAPYLYRGEDYVQYTRGRFGIKKGLPKVLHLLDKYGVKATFNVCGYIAETYPETVREIAAKQHDVAVHGFLHEDFTKLSREEASTTLDRAMRRGTNRRIPRLLRA